MWIIDVRLRSLHDCYQLQSRHVACSLLLATYVVHLHCRVDHCCDITLDVHWHARRQHIWMTFDKLCDFCLLLLQVPGHVCIDICKHARERWLRLSLSNIQCLHDLCIYTDGSIPARMHKRTHAKYGRSVHTCNAWKISAHKLGKLSGL